MKIIDTHTHLFLPEFDHDRDEVIQRALENGVGKMILPNVDCQTIESIFALSEKYPEICFPAVALHPCSINKDYLNDLDTIKNHIEKKNVVAIGETGLDFYWDISFKDEQIDAFEIQINWAKKFKLPLIIHVRNSHDEVIRVLKKNYDESLSGVFHCFTGSYQQAMEIIDLGFMLGIGGVLTFKNSDLSEVLKRISIEHIVLETDSPYLAPMPFRGKRNESAYLEYIVAKLSEIYNKEVNWIMLKTIENAERLFKGINNKN